MPIDPAPGQGILQAYQVGFQLRKAELDRQQRQQEFIQSLEQRQKEFEQSHKLDVDRFKALAKIREGQQALRRSTALAGLAQGIQQGKATGTITDVGGAIALGNIFEQPEEVSKALWQSFATPTQAGQAQADIIKSTTEAQANLAGAIANAKSDAEVRQILARGYVTSINQSNLQAQRQRDAVAMQALRNRDNLALQKVKDDAAMARVERKEQLRTIEKNKLSGDSAVDAYYNSVTSGDLDSITQVPTRNGLRAQVIEKVNQGGRKFLFSGDVQDTVTVAGRLKSFVSLYESFIKKNTDEFQSEDTELLGEVWNSTVGKVLEHFQAGDWGKGIREMQALLGNLVHGIGGESAARLSDADIERMKGFLPVKNMTSLQAAQRLEKLKGFLNEKVKEIFDSRKLSPLQRREMLTRMGTIGFIDPNSVGANVGGSETSGTRFNVGEIEDPEALRKQLESMGYEVTF